MGPGELTDFGYLPDGSILAIGKTGKNTWVSTTGQIQDVATLPVKTDGDVGLVGLSIAPDYATTRHLYLTRAITTANGYIMRAARFTATGTDQPTGLAAEKVLLDIPGNTNIHGMTTVLAAPDGTVWISMGDSSRFEGAADPFALKAQDLDQPYGKLFRITADGAGVPDNPYYVAANPNSNRSKVFASGFRSPFRFSLDQSTGLPVVGDVGWGTWEEINVVQKGGNQGWPCFEGNQPADGFSAMAACASVVNTPPLLAIPHGKTINNGNSVTGGIVYKGSSYPDEYQDAYFFGDYAMQTIWTAKYDAQGKLVRGQEVPPKFTGIRGPVRFAAADNGDIVFADIFTGTLRRLSYVIGNAEPVAVATSETNADTRTVTFDGSGSYDFDKNDLTYHWDFGDGTTGTGAKVSHTYAADVEKVTAKLTVKDTFDASGSTEITVAPGNHSPVLTMTDPREHTFAVGEEIKVGATVTDAEDGELPVTWTTLVRHCPENAACHAHPDAGGTGPEFLKPFTDHTDSSIEITAKATDSAGVTTQKTYIARPREHRLTLVGSTAAALRITPEGGASSTVQTDARAVYGRIRVRWQALGWESGPLGYPTNDETATPDNVGRYTHFTKGGSIYWSMATDSHGVWGEIRKRWATMGWERSCLKYPTTDELVVTGGRQNNFQGGYLFWNSSTGGVTSSC